MIWGHLFFQRNLTRLDMPRLTETQPAPGGIDIAICCRYCPYLSDLVLTMALGSGSQSFVSYESAGAAWPLSLQEEKSP